MIHALIKKIAGRVHGYKYGIGDILWVMRRKSETKWGSCPACKGTGVIRVNGKDCPCPAQSSRPGHSDHWCAKRTIWLYTAPEPILVDRVYMQKADENGWTDRQNWYGSREMIYHETILFRDRQQAEQFCGEDNSLSGEDSHCDLYYNGDLSYIIDTFHVAPGPCLLGQHQHV